MSIQEQELHLRSREVKFWTVIKSFTYKIIFLIYGEGLIFSSYLSSITGHEQCHQIWTSFMHLEI